MAYNSPQMSKDRTSPPPSDLPLRAPSGPFELQEDDTTPSIQTDHDYDIRVGITDWSGRGQDTAETQFSTNLLSAGSTTYSADGGLSPPASQYSPVTPETASTDGGFEDFRSSAGAAKTPFNFTPVQYMAGPQGSDGKSEVLGKRRGHKYRHSSIHASHMDSIIRSPLPQRTPLSIPASLPMPTRKEAWRSMTRHQTARLAWCGCHFVIAAYVQFSGAGSLAMTALSRLLLFDAASATVCVVVDVMGNFEVWEGSSIKHPFGLGRADVLAGFAMAVFVAFMGLDVISHGIQHSLENVGHHESHSPHSHERVTTGSVDVASLLAIVSTLISAFVLKNHARISKAMRLELLAGWGRIFSNPSHFLTLSCSILLLLLPLLSVNTYGWFDKTLSFVIASLMIALGVRLGSSLASMLLMSFKPSASNKGAVRKVIDEIAQSDPAVTEVEEARFWQVHYGFCMANLKLRYRSRHGGYRVGEDVAKIRQQVSSLIRQQLGGGRWDVSIQMTLEAN